MKLNYFQAIMDITERNANNFRCAVARLDLLTKAISTKNPEIIDRQVKMAETFLKSDNAKLEPFHIDI